MSITNGLRLYADGSNLLLHVIELRDFFHVSETRFTSTFMTQLPPVLAIRFGVRSTAVLAMLYTAALGIVPITCYALSIWDDAPRAAAFLRHLRGGCVLSLARSKTSRVLLVQSQYTGWQPFDPHQPPDIDSVKSGGTICH